MLKGKTVLLGVTGSIAAYKSAMLTSMLVKAGANVEVIMTKNSTQFINPITFESLTGNKCIVDTFDRNFEFQVEHISLANAADIVVIAPASANIVGKLASGIADDMLTTTVMACKCKKFIATAMNTNMYENPIFQHNLDFLKQYGYEEIAPSEGYLACRTVGKGKMQEPEIIYEHIIRELAYEKDFVGKKVLVTAGPTREAIDPVRYISNNSTGKMGFAIAKMAMLRGADVTLIKGPTTIPVPQFVKVIDVISAADMYNAVKENYEQQDIIIKSAAVADYTPKVTSDEKIKKNADEAAIALQSTKDILKFLGENRRENQILCGFSMETENMIENSKVKLKKKKVDIIAANNLKVEGAGFATDTNVITLITKDKVKELPLMTKEKVAERLLDEIISIMKESPESENV